MPDQPKELNPLDLLKANQVAEWLSISLRQLRHLSREGKLPAPIVIGQRTLRWVRKDIDEFITNA